MSIRVWGALVFGILGACADTPAEPAIDPPCSTPLTLARGAVRVVSGASSVSCIVVASTSDASEFLFVSANAAPVQDDVHPYMISGILGSRLSSALSDAFGRDDPLTEVADRAHDVGAFQITFEDRLRHAERAQLRGFSLSGLARGSRTSGHSVMPAKEAGARSAPPTVGDTMMYRVPNAASSNMCTNFSNVRAVVKAVGTKALVVQDIDASVGGFTAQDFSDIASEFDNLIYPVDEQWFGTPTDINGDGHITILFTPAVNRLTPTGSLGYAGGFFYASDLIARSIPSQAWSCPASNEQEIFYLLTPDPNGQVNGNRFTVITARESSRGTTAHELQHMINQGVRQSTTLAAQPEVTWLNEGLSHLAEEAVGRAARGFNDFTRLTWNSVLTDLDDFDSFFRQNLLRFRFWMQRPDLASPISTLAGSQLAPRGAAWALVRYAVDQYSGGNARAFTRALVAGPQIDVANLEARTRVSFDELLPGFLVANFADSTVSGLSARYTYTSWSMRDAMTSLNGGQYPLLVTTMPVEQTTQSRSGSGNYFLLARPAGAQAATFRMLAPSGGTVGFPDARVYVVRLK